MKFFAGVARPTIRSERELAQYVTLVTACASAFALAIDIIIQLAFFIDWSRCLRAWAATAVICLVVAPPLAYAIGRAHLQLYRAKQLADANGPHRLADRPRQSPRADRGRRNRSWPTSSR